MERRFELTDVNILSKLELIWHNCFRNKITIRFMAYELYSLCCQCFGFRQETKRKIMLLNVTDI